MRSTGFTLSVQPVSDGFGIRYSLDKCKDTARNTETIAKISSTGFGGGSGVSKEGGNSTVPGDTGCGGGSGGNSVPGNAIVADDPALNPTSRSNPVLTWDMF